MKTFMDKVKEYWSSFKGLILAHPTAAAIIIAALGAILIIALIR